MIRDICNSNSAPVLNSLSVEGNQEVAKIFQYIDFSIGNFHDYYMTFGDSEKKNRITDLLISCFEDYLSLFNNGYLSIRFSKGPTEVESTREPDIGVFPDQSRIYSSLLLFLKQSVYMIPHIPLNMFQVAPVALNVLNGACMPLMTIYAA
jgi:hypothetical protein